MSSRDPNASSNTQANCAAWPKRESGCGGLDSRGAVGRHRVAVGRSRRTRRCSDAEAAEYPLHHGRRHRLVQHRRLSSGHHVGQDAEPGQLAAQGMRFTDYYAEASCTAGRANFITGELPIRTGLTTVGQAGADVGMPAQAPTIATALKAMGYTTGQFGKNHLGDLNKYLPCVHGFDEFFGYLYHLDAMSDPYWYSYPKDPAIRKAVGPAQSSALLGERHRRSDRRSALGQGRQAEDRRRGPAGARTKYRTHALWRRRRRCRRR